MENEPETQDAREAIMRGVYAVLADEGFPGLTTQRVADVAGCSQSLVHYHYGTKEDLVVAFLEWVQAGEGDWLSGIKGATAEERLRHFVDLQLSLPRDDEHGRFNVAFLELNAAASRNERYATALRDFSELVHNAIADIVREGIEAGEFRDVDPDATARFLRHALQGAVAESFTLDLHGAKAEARAAVETYLERVLLQESA